MAKIEVTFSLKSYVMRQRTKKYPITAKYGSFMSSFFNGVFIEGANKAQKEYKTCKDAILGLREASEHVKRVKN